MAVAASRLQDKMESVRLVPTRGRKDDENTVTSAAAAACVLLLVLLALGCSK